MTLAFTFKPTCPYVPFRCTSHSLVTSSHIIPVYIPYSLLFYFFGICDIRYHYSLSSFPYFLDAHFVLFVVLTVASPCHAGTISPAGLILAHCFVCLCIRYLVFGIPSFVYALSCSVYSNRLYTCFPGKTSKPDRTLPVKMSFNSPRNSEIPA